MAVEVAQNAPAGPGWRRRRWVLSGWERVHPYAVKPSSTVAEALRHPERPGRLFECACKAGRLCRPTGLVGSGWAMPWPSVLIPPKVAPATSWSTPRAAAAAFIVGRLSTRDHRGLRLLRDRHFPTSPGGRSTSPRWPFHGEPGYSSTSSRPGGRSQRSWATLQRTTPPWWSTSPTPSSRQGRSGPGVHA